MVVYEFSLRICEDNKFPFTVYEDNKSAFTVYENTPLLSISAEQFYEYLILRISVLY